MSQPSPARQDCLSLVVRRELLSPSLRRRPWDNLPSCTRCLLDPQRRSTLGWWRRTVRLQCGRSPASRPLRGHMMVSRIRSITTSSLLIQKPVVELEPMSLFYSSNPEYPPAYSTSTSRGIPQPTPYIGHMLSDPYYSSRPSTPPLTRYHSSPDSTPSSSRLLETPHDTPTRSTGSHLAYSPAYFAGSRPVTPPTPFNNLSYYAADSYSLYESKGSYNFSPLYDGSTTPNAPGVHSV